MSTTCLQVTITKLQVSSIHLKNLPLRAVHSLTITSCGWLIIFIVYPYLSQVWPPPRISVANEVRDSRTYKCTVMSSWLSWVLIASWEGGRTQCLFVSTHLLNSFPGFNAAKQQKSVHGRRNWLVGGHWLGRGAYATSTIGEEPLLFLRCSLGFNKQILLVLRIYSCWNVPWYPWFSGLFFSKFPSFTCSHQVWSMPMTLEVISRVDSVKGWQMLTHH